MRVVAGLLRGLSFMLMGVFHKSLLIKVTALSKEHAYTIRGNAYIILALSGEDRADERTTGASKQIQALLQSAFALNIVQVMLLGFERGSTKDPGCSFSR